MIFVVLYKYLNCAVDKTIDTGIDCNTNYGIILLMLFTTSLEKAFENKPNQKDVYLCHLSEAFFANCTPW